MNPNASSSGAGSHGESGNHLGEVLIDDRRIAVEHSGHNTLWLTYREHRVHRNLGVVRWDETTTPRLTVSPHEASWVCPGSRRADELVASVMDLYRTKLGLPDHPDQATGRQTEPQLGIDDPTLPGVVFDAALSRSRTSPASNPARGTAAVPMTPIGDDS